MPTVLGKRKADSAADGASVSQEDACDIFRRHFESQFQPLPAAQTALAELAGEVQFEGESSESEWGGLSDSERDEAQVEVVDHRGSAVADDSSMSKRELKAFMSSRPPGATPLPKPNPPRPSSDPESSAAMLANDLALQRLLSESHLLSRDPASSAPFAAGRMRQKSLDLRVQALGANVESIFAQKKIPMALRKGQAANRAAREAKRRREARENGVVLERKGGKRPERPRRKTGEVDVGRPAVGRLKGAELRLSERDARSIEGSGEGRGGRGGLRARGRR